MKKSVFVCAALLALTVTVSPVRACNYGVGANFVPAATGYSSFASSRVVTTSNFVDFNPAVTVVNHGFAFNAFTPFVTNVPVVNQVVVNKRVVQKNVVKQRARSKTVVKSKTRVR